MDLEKKTALMEAIAQVDWSELSREARRDRRQGKRVPLTFPIEVTGFAQNGRMFGEITRTMDISECGCSFTLKAEVQRGDVVAIRLLSRRDGETPASTPLLFRIVWRTRAANCWKFGAFKLQQENIWHVAFPPKEHPADPAA